MSYFNQLVSALKTTATAAYHATGASQVVQGASEVIGNAGAGGTWGGMARGAARMAVGGAALYTLPTAPLRTMAVMGAGTLLANTSREDIGQTVKRAGKSLGQPRMIEAGRRLQYGHLSADELFQQHPAAFLRKYAVQSSIQAPDDPGGVSSPAMQFQFRTVTGNTSAFPQQQQITDASGTTRTPAAHLQLIRSTSAALHQQTHNSVQVGNDFSAAFLPMLQSQDDQMHAPRHQNGKPGPGNVAGFNQGRIRPRNLDRHEASTIVTTQLSGCSVTRQRSAFLHIRPDQDGATLQNTLSPHGATFGRNDYPNGQRAFTMIRSKPDGSARLHYQVQDGPGGVIRSGRRSL